MKSPTSRSLELLRKEGYTAQVVERWNQFARIRQDLFGFIDIVAVRSDQVGVLGVQCTSADNMAARRRKILEEPRAAVWVAAGNRIQIHGWSKKGAKGERKTWQCNVEIPQLKQRFSRT